ncbi:LysR family transcriptional regulator [Microbacterium aquimaris]|uniref:LysR family transcriptional regulator n=1 Tax=Microbacterium aquimaris TaxID=459816 RepID=UPI002AD4E8AE|nr:LysR family transcriptional regulator [Microbacterium aquimaris]MDZ8274882.1 LysR family transcriptional regulator [Microbacterium aquimaris]
MTADARHLRVFLAICEAGSITDAAAELRMSQPTVSRILQALESHLGVRLVDRSTHHLHLTDAGERYRPRAAAAVRALEATLDPNALGSRALVIGYSWAAFGPRSGELLERWRSLHPDAPMSLRRVPERDAGLGSADVDAAVVRDLDPGRRVSRTWIAREPRVAAVAARGPLAAREQLTLDDLAAHPLVQNTRYGTTTRELWDSVDPPARIVEVASTDDWLFAISAGDGVGVTTSATGAMHNLDGVVYRPLVDAPAVTVELAWNEPAAHPLTTALAHFLADAGL